MDKNFALKDSQSTLNSNVYSRRLRTGSHVDAMTPAGGKLLLKRAAATPKARSPMTRISAHSRSRLAVASRCLPYTTAQITYCGAVPCRQRKVSNSVFELNLLRRP